MLPRFYPILDTETASSRGIEVIAAARQIIDAGAQILQLRHKGFFSRGVFETIQQIAGLCGQAGIPFVVNDRPDFARLLNAGVHLGQDDLPPSSVRQIVGKDTLVGFSTHNENQLRAAAEEPADYLALGPIFGTISKRNPDPQIGVEGLRRLRSLTARPLVAIGGITRENAPAVLDAGADSVAVIGDLFPSDGGIEDRVREWLVRTA